MLIEMTQSKVYLMFFKPIELKLLYVSWVRIRVTSILEEDG